MKLKTFILKYRLWLIILPIAISLIMALPLKNARINPDLMEYLPEDIESKINMDKLEDVFGKYDPVIIIVEAEDILNQQTLERLYDINKKIKQSRELDDLISIFESKYIRGEDGMMLVDPVIGRVPKTEIDKELLRKQIKDNELAYKLLVSEDFRYTIFIVNIAEGVSDDVAINLIDKIINEFPGEEKFYLNGLPFLRDEIQSLATRDLAILFPLGMLIMIAFLYISFRQLRSVLLPFSVVLMSIIVSMGLMPLLGYELSMIAVLVPILMISIANNYGVHIVARYQEIRMHNPEWTMQQITAETISLLNVPIILTALTTIVGILGMAAHIMIPAKQMGIVSAVGIGFALLLSIFFIPALMSYMKKGNPKKYTNGGKSGIINKLLLWAGSITTASPRKVIIAFLLFFIISGIGISRLRVSINLESMLSSSHPMQQSTKIANEHFGGTKNLSVLFTGDIKSPEAMKNIEYFGDELEKIPLVKNVNSIAKVIKIISKALNDPGDEYYGIIPNNREAIAQYIEFYSMSGDPEDFERIVDFDYTKSLLNVQFKANDINDFYFVKNKIDELISQSEFAVLQSGQPMVEIEMAKAILAGQIYSLAFALFAILGLLWIIFRSIRAGLLGSLPLLMSIVCNFGLMGWLGIELDIATSLLSSIAVGIGVDYTIHLFWRLKQEIKNGSNITEAVKTTLSTTGRGITINAFSVIIGFSALFFSGLFILKTFAFLIIFSILVCLIGALILMPSICVISNPKFLK
ncbi:MAG: RND family transporter [Bacteroidetes bacterium]|nr:RND family transporter [Bacteroidota bacterium]